MVAAIMLGRGALQSPQAFSIGIVLAAFVAHFALAIVFALVLGLIMTSFNLDSSMGMASLAGGAFAAAVYVINFYGMTQFFPGSQKHATGPACSLTSSSVSWRRTCT
jgi:hypothetical protein